jgi:hypothetical protein
MMPAYDPGVIAVSAGVGALTVVPSEETEVTEVCASKVPCRLKYWTIGMPYSDENPDPTIVVVAEGLAR